MVQFPLLCCPFSSKHFNTWAGECGSTWSSSFISCYKCSSLLQHLQPYRLLLLPYHIYIPLCTDSSLLLQLYNRFYQILQRQNEALPWTDIRTPSTRRETTAMLCSAVISTTKLLMTRVPPVSVTAVTTGASTSSPLEYAKPHSHLPDSGRIEGNKVRESTKEAAKTTTEKMSRRIFLQNSHWKRRARRHDRKIFKCEAVRLCGDGTFKLLPSCGPNWQLYTVYGQKNGYTVPSVFPLLPDKRKETYIHLFTQLKSWSEGASQTWEFQFFPGRLWAKCFPGCKRSFP